MNTEKRNIKSRELAFRRAIIARTQKIGFVNNNKKHGGFVRNRKIHHRASSLPKHRIFKKNLNAKNLAAKKSGREQKSVAHLDLRAFFLLHLCVRGEACARGGGGVIGAKCLVGLGALVQAELLWWRAMKKIEIRRWR